MNKILVLDGGIGHLLKSRGVEKLCSGLSYDELFAAGCLANEVCPDVVERAHVEFVNAGADVLTTNTFGCTQRSLEKVGRAGKAIELVAAGARIAQDVANSSTRFVRVAGCLPPLGESYKPCLDFELLQAEYKEIAAALAPHVDIFLCETMSSIAEALAAATAVSLQSEGSTPCWVSFTLQDNDKALLRGGETLNDAVKAMLEIPGIEAVLVNCCAPQAISAAIPIMKECLRGAGVGMRIGGYANGFLKTTSEWLGEGGSGDRCDVLRPPREEYDSNGVILPEAYAKHVQEWVAMGCEIVGGCCGIGPRHIEMLSSQRNGV